MRDFSPDQPAATNQSLNRDQEESERAASLEHSVSDVVRILIFGVSSPHFPIQFSCSTALCAIKCGTACVRMQEHENSLAFSQRRIRRRCLSIGIICAPGKAPKTMLSRSFVANLRRTSQFPPDQSSFARELRMVGSNASGPYQRTGSGVGKQNSYFRLSARRNGSNKAPRKHC